MRCLAPVVKGSSSSGERRDKRRIQSGWGNHCGRVSTINDGGVPLACPNEFEGRYAKRLTDALGFWFSTLSLARFGTESSPDPQKSGGQSRGQELHHPVYLAKSGPPDAVRDHVRGGIGSSTDSPEPLADRAYKHMPRAGSWIFSTF